MSAARKRTGLPLCLYANAPIAEAVGGLADILISSPDRDFSTPRITLSHWAPFDQWLYLDHDAQVVGDDWRFGFDALDRGFDLALCSIVGEADKACLGDSALFPEMQAVFPEIPRWAFYAQLGVIYGRRSEQLSQFEEHWLSAQQAFGPGFLRLQPSFTAAHWHFGAPLRLYILPPHFNCRQGYRERGGQGELPVFPALRGEIQILHRKPWLLNEAVTDGAG
jgi:hypothetical protein